MLKPVVLHTWRIVARSQVAPMLYEMVPSWNFGGSALASRAGRCSRGPAAVAPAAARNPRRLTSTVIEAISFLPMEHPPKGNDAKKFEVHARMGRMEPTLQVALDFLELSRAMVV